MHNIRTRESKCSFAESQVELFKILSSLYLYLVVYHTIRCHSFHSMCCTASYMDLLLPGRVLYLDTHSWIFMFTFSGVKTQKGLNPRHEASSSSCFPRYTPDQFTAFFDNLKDRQILLSTVCETCSHITSLSRACSN